MKYAEIENVDPGMRFKTLSGLVVETSGSSLEVDVNRDDAEKIYTHEVVIVEGPGQGQKFMHNLDYAEKL